MTQKYNEMYGFHLVSPVKLHRFKGPLSFHDIQPYLQENFLDDNKIEIFSLQTDKDIERVINFDEQVVGINRAEFLWPWVRWGRITIIKPRPIIITLCAVDDKNNVLGYGSISPAMDAHKIGPLYAKEDQIAFHIIAELLKMYNDDVRPVHDIIINVPSTNSAMNDTLNEIGINKIFELDMSYTKNLPEIYYKWIYSSTTNVAQID